MNTDGNLYALRQYEKQQAQEDAKCEFIADKSAEIQEAILDFKLGEDAPFFKDNSGNKHELSDFIADMEIDAHLFAEFLSGGTLLKDKLNTQLEEFCDEIAADFADNMEPEPYEDY